MNDRNQDARALRREALVARASLQRLQLAAAADRLRERSAGVRGLGRLALRVAGAMHQGSAAHALSATGARPWLLSGGLVLLRLARRSPTGRWLLGAAALAGAVWWVARSLRAPDSPPDGSG